MSHPQLQMEDYGGNRGANVMIRCPSCRAKRNISRAMGRRGAENLPACRGRHPHLSTFENCAERSMVLVVGASNQWFAQTLSALAVPQVGASALQAKVEQLWGDLADVAQAERLREVRALTGFTRLDAPDPEDPDLVTRAPLARDRPTWVPASEVRGEGIFLRIDLALMAAWETRVRDSDVVREHMEAFRRFRTNRYSDRAPTDFDPMRGWPQARYIGIAGRNRAANPHRAAGAA